MRFALFVAATLALATSPARAIVTCPDAPRRPIPLPEQAGQKCQKAIAKEASKFAATRMQVLAACMQKQEPGLCPESKDTTKIEKAADKAADKITKSCGSAEALAGLTTSYATTPNPAVIQSCTLSQHTAWTTVLLGINNGTPGKIVDDKDRDKCAKELSKQGNAYLKSALATMNKCFKKQMKQGTPGSDVSAACVPSWGDGALILPTDAKTASALETLAEKTEKAIAKKCDLTSPDAGIESLFACPGAETVEDLQICIICENQRGAVELFTQENGESFQGLVGSGSTIGSFVDAASPGDKFLVLSGTYAENLTIGTDGLQLVGCGAATNDRPQIVPPATDPSPNGVFAADVDGLLFQSLEVIGWDENGIFVQGADGVTFRDVIGDGGEGQSSVYAIYPVQSSDVLVEGCVARNIADAGIYVGQDMRPIVRYNTAEFNVAGIEIENSEFAQVYGNYSTNNTGGLLVFKLPGPPLQVSNDHEVFDNVLIGNNTTNFGDPNSSVGTVPDGTGLLVLSNDTSDFHHNIVQDNNTFGIALLDQAVINSLNPPGPFNPPSPEQSSSGNTFRSNLVTGNANAPDSEGPNSVPAGVASNILYILGEAAPNCFEGNVVADGPDPIGLEQSVCPPVP